MLEELNQASLLNHVDQGLNYKHDESVRKEMEPKSEFKWWLDGWLEAWLGGWHEGRLEEKREFATKLIAKGYPIGEIVELTDLSREEIERL